MLYRALLHLRAALEGIRKQDGYYHDVQEAAVHMDPSTTIADAVSVDADRPFILIELRSDVRTYFPQDEMKVRVPVIVHWIGDVRDPDDALDDTALLRTFLQASADVERAVRVDASRGGVVMETLVTNTRIAEFIEGGRVWAELTLELVFYRTHGDAVVAS